MRKFVRKLVRLYYSLPVQLLVSQVMQHRSILAFWIFLLLIVTQSIMTGMGVPYQFLEPEYLRQVNGLSFFWVGISLGFFTLAHHMTCYILDGYKFFFIALLRRPFRMFVLNNSVMPLLFWVVYAVQIVRFQSINPRFDGWQIAWLLVCLFGGGVAVIGLGFLYFTYTDHNALARVSKRVVEGLGSQVRVQQRIRQGIEQGVRVESYFIWPWATRRVPQNIKGDHRPILRVLTQNHANAIVIVTVFLLLLVLMGVFQEYTAAQLPSAATLTLLMAFFVMLVGALTFWFRRWGAVLIVLVLAVFYLWNKYEPFNGKHMAFGMDYMAPAADYSLTHIHELASAQNIAADYKAGEQLLNNWLQRYYAKHGAKAPKPKLLLIGVTGGGLRSATWTMTCLQKADSALHGNLADYWRLTTGASGGMMGAAFYRELLLWDEAALGSQRNDPRQLSAISSDVLNRVMFNMVANLFLPKAPYTQKQDAISRDRGWAFESQFMENTRQFHGRRLKDYAAPELEARVPMLLFAPTIINDGRQLLISAQPISYLLQPQPFNAVYSNEISGVEFRRMFGPQKADDLRITTAIRMSASFPYILPFAELPSDPPIQVMDAGVFDNFGVFLSMKYVFAFRHWLARHTSGVVYLQIRDSEQEQQAFGLGEQTLLDRITGVFGSTYHSFAESKDFQNDDLLAYTQTLLGVPLDVVDLQYIPAVRDQEAALNFHLTAREKKDIISSVAHPVNRQALAMLAQLLGGQTPPPASRPPRQ
jgi:hypothetical protein